MEQTETGSHSKVHGLVVIYTGNGKGKTSAALGSVMRTVGHGLKCKMIQFIKGSGKAGELKLVDRLGPQFDIEQEGLGFTFTNKHSMVEHKIAAQAALAKAQEAIASGDYHTVILDEIFYARKKDLVSSKEVINLIDIKPKQMHLVMTGRGAPDDITERADLVTEMREIKHPKKLGVRAQKGIDF
ncbi:MAG TPA: cob(I)yrinic acid a,c-diamide adenosyltransferase [Nitrospinota bacterium]|nr:cob(I)yrinic acid a,c-diamide adenosyltransferase [Nitrospinota bacterium]